MRRVAKLADHRHSGSLAHRFRRRRFQLFASLLRSVPAPVRILDVGGEPGFWQQMGTAGLPEVEIVLLNRRALQTGGQSLTAIVGDAREMPEIDDRGFDVAFSNSVIEHVGTLADQGRMAAEIRRVAKRFFVQTPNRYFPIEPHFLFPGFQFLPLGVRAELVRRFAIGHGPALEDPDVARAAVAEIRLLTGREVAALFPGARIHRERVLGLTKSFVAYGGWGP